jgi:oligopeptidase A
MTVNNNPLLNIGFAFPFDAVRAEHIEPGVKDLLASAAQALLAIEEAAGPRTYRNTLHALDFATEPLERAMRLVGHLESVASTPLLRQAYNAVEPEVSSFYAGIPLRPKLWEAVQEFAKTPEAAQLTGPKARYLKKTIDEFRRSGANLDEADKQKLRDMSRTLSELTSKFSQNVVDATAAYELIVTDEAKLAGLPASAIEAARAEAASKGVAGYRFTLQAPSMIPVVTYLDDRKIREQIWRAYNTRAASGERDNGPLIGRILELRNAQARLLGYADFAAMVLEDRMAHSSETALRFVEDLQSRATPFFRRETAALQAFRAEYDGAPNGATPPPLEAWDVGYYSEKERKAVYDFDEEQLRPYFAIDSVVAGLFETARRLYDVRIERNHELPTWHPDALAYDLFDKTGEHLASFYTDFYPRDEKRGGAWMNSFISGTLQDGKLTPHLGLICANVTPPVGNKPALLSHSEVVTLFHEFGHLLHQCLSRVEVRSLAGANVAWDFVELPSQIMENWCWEKEALDTFAKHYETGSPIPDDLLGKMQRARSYRAASVMMRQLGFAAVDLALHVTYDPARDGDVLRFARNAMQPFVTAPFPEDYAMLASFTHLFSSAVGYAAGYYSYKWAEVLDADAFTRFKELGIYSPEAGNSFRLAILERGDSEDPMLLYRAFMGREPKLDALLRRFGLDETEVAA